MRAVAPFLKKLSSILPFVGCLLCPACLASIGALLSPLGVRVTIGATGEGPTTLLAALALLLAVREALRVPTRAPLLLAVAAGAMFASSRAFRMPEPLELAGLGLLPLSSIWARLAERSDRAGGCECDSHEP